MTRRPVVLSIAGSDSSGGAGVQADLKAIEANGGYAATVITAVTAQNTRGIRRVDRLPAESIEAQIEAVLDDLDVAAVKIGMLGDAEAVAAVARGVGRQSGPIVCDPVMRSSTGAPLIDAAGIEALRGELLPRVTLVTPNRYEAEALAGMRIGNLAEAEVAAGKIRELGARAVLITGGHLRETPATDLLVDEHGTRSFAGDPIDTPHTHGTGCVYSAAIATRLARGAGLVQAIELAKRFLGETLRHGLLVGHGSGPVDPLYAVHASRARRE